MISGRSPRPSGDFGLHTVPMLSVVDGLSHEVQDDRPMLGPAGGVYIAVCGLRILPAALGCRSDRRCPQCAAVCEPASTSRRASRRRVAQWLRNWCRFSHDSTTAWISMGNQDASARAVAR